MSYQLLSNCQHWRANCFPALHWVARGWPRRSYKSVRTISHLLWLHKIYTTVRKMERRNLKSAWSLASIIVLLSEWAWFDRQAHGVDPTSDQNKIGQTARSVLRHAVRNSKSFRINMGWGKYKRQNLNFSALKCQEWALMVYITALFFILNLSDYISSRISEFLKSGQIKSIPSLCRWCSSRLHLVLASWIYADVHRTLRRAISF